MHEYDASGRLVRSTTTREEEFDRDQVDLLLAWRWWQKDTGPHGHRLSETTSDAADPSGSGSLRFTAQGPFWDHAEKARLDAIDNYRKQFPKDDPPNLHGAYWRVERHDYSE